MAAPRTGMLLLGALCVHPQPIPIRVPPQPVSDVPLSPRCDANPRVKTFTCCVLLPPIDVHAQSARIGCVIFRVELPKEVANLKISDFDDAAAQRHPCCTNQNIPRPAFRETDQLHEPPQVVSANREE